MQNAARVSDAVCHGGVIASGSGDTTINSCNAAITGGSVATCAFHGAAPVASGSGSVFINSCNAARLGDVCGCGAAVASGSGNVYIGG
ncbi:MULTISPECIES: PAAR domain-containing protein [Erwiniaceae]|uniref:PAAR domain-containing protein n=1 Tax=Enterobacter agglomerans TaxID=549 RepID=A0ACC5RM24_ENTAG|nr:MULTISPECIES: PAAR domain-containing protein [Erwiniaceae]MBK4725761.1 PAAR domain-containing protein [Pantoea agglomerans]UDQ80444.1 PAAR domain-containing protein [Erwinia rhapontici]